MTNLSYKTLLIILLFLLIPIILLLRINQKPSPTSAWWNDSWTYRNNLQITNNTSPETNVYTTLSIGTSSLIAAGKLQADCDDLRFTNQSGNLLPYYLVSGCGTTATSINVNHDTFPSGQQTIYFYYGNSSASAGTAASNFSTEASDYSVGSTGSEETGTGPIAHWRFDESIGTTAYDSAGNNHAVLGSGNSAPTWQTEDQCISGRCLYFDGNDYTDSGDILNMRTSDMTISTWVKTSYTSANQYIVSKALAGFQNYRYAVGIYTSGTARLFMQGNGGSDVIINGNTPIADGNWHLLTFIYDRDSLAKIYVDGVFDSSQSISHWNNVDMVSNNPFRIGTYTAADNISITASFFGSLDEVKIYNYARTAQQILQDYNLGAVNIGHQSETIGTTLPTPIAHYRFDEGYGTTTRNQISGQPNITLGTGSTAVTWTNNGKFGKALSFGANSVAIQSSFSSDFEYWGTGGISTSAWIYANSAETNGGYIISKPWNSSGYYNWQLKYNSNNTISFQMRGNGSVQTITTTDTIPTQQWHYVAATANDDDSFKIYIDGKLSKSGTWSITDWGMTDNNLTTAIGCIHPYGGTYCQAGASTAFNGLIDEVKVYQSALTADQIKLDYNQGQAMVMGSSTKDNIYIAYDSFTRADGTLNSTESTDPYGKTITPLTWHGATWIVSSAAAANTPTLGENLITNGSFETGNPPTSWSQNGTPTVYEQSSTQAQEGTYSLHITADEVNEGTSQNISMVTDQWYSFDAYFYPISGTTYYFFTNNGYNPYFLYLSANQWNHLVGADIAKYFQIAIRSYPYDYYVDNVSAYHLNTQELFATVNTATPNLIASTDFTFDQYHTRTPTGLILRADSTTNPQNYLLAYITRGSTNNSGQFRLLKCLNGTYSSVTSYILYDAGTSYSNGGTLKIALEGSTIKSYYRNALLTTSTVTDSEILHNTVHGLFSSYAGSTFDNFTLQTQVASSQDNCPPGSLFDCDQGPVAHWKLDEKSGTFAYDSSGNNKTGTLASGSSAPSWTTGKIGAALSFDGNDYVDVGAGPSSTKTISFWLNPSSATTYPLDLKGTAYIWIDSDIVTAVGLTSPSIYVNGVGTSQISTGSWQHLTITTNSPVNASDLDIGRIEGIGFYQGLLDHITFYNYARTPAQIAWDYNRGKPIAHWRLDECQGTVAHSSADPATAGSGLHGTINADTIGTCTSASSASAWYDGRNGKLSASLYLDGDADYISVGDIGVSATAVSFWLKPDSTTQSILELSATDSIAISSGTVSVTGFGTETIYVDGSLSSTIPDTNWHHITVVSSANIPANTVNIGKIGSSYYSGQIDEVQIFNYALTAQQVKTLHNGGAVSFTD